MKTIENNAVYSRNYFFRVALSMYWKDWVLISKKYIMCDNIDSIVQKQVMLTTSSVNYVFTHPFKTQQDHIFILLMFNLEVSLAQGKFI